MANKEERKNELVAKLAYGLVYVLVVGLVVLLDFGLVAGLVFGLFVTLAFGLFVLLDYELVYGLVFGLFVTLAFGLFVLLDYGLVFFALVYGLIYVLVAGLAVVFIDTLIKKNQRRNMKKINEDAQEEGWKEDFAYQFEGWLIATLFLIIPFILVCIGGFLLLYGLFRFIILGY